MEITVTPAGGDPVRVVLGPMDGLPSPSVAEVISQQLNLHSAFIVSGRRLSQTFQSSLILSQLQLNLDLLRGRTHW